MKGYKQAMMVRCRVGATSNIYLLNLIFKH